MDLVGIKARHKHIIQKLENRILPDKVTNLLITVDVPQLVAEVERLREALRWYGDRVQDYFGVTDDKTWSTASIELQEDHGQRARAALGEE